MNALAPVMIGSRTLDAVQTSKIYANPEPTRQRAHTYSRHILVTYRPEVVANAFIRALE